MSDRLLLIADDLTGALDTAVQFSRAGVSTFVRTGTSPTPDVGSTVLAVDIESRHLLPGEAAGRVQRCVEAAMKAGIRRFYKKTDSTLRGNVGAELAALLHATGVSELYFVPALPEARRVTRGGVQYVDGLPLHRSRYSRDVADPVRESSVSAIIASQADTAVVGIPRGADPAAILAETRRPVVLVFDAETTDDLEAVAGRLANLGPPRLLAGCAGFAAVVPGLLGLQRQAIPAPALRSPLLVVCGSRNEVSRLQVRRAETLGIPCGRLSASDPSDVVRGALSGTGSAVLVSDDPVSAGSFVRRIIEQTRVGTLAVFGGDTAFRLTDALGIHGLWPLGEICPGVVASRLQGAPSVASAAGMHLVTKAGGFGPIDVIPRIREALDREE